MLSTRLAFRHAGTAAIGAVGVVVAAVIVISASGILKSDEPAGEPVRSCDRSRLAVSVPDTPATDDDDHQIDRPICSCNATAKSRRTVEERRALELACRLYSDERCGHEFSVFATPRHGDRAAVIVRRSTGDCGACGALAVAAVFQKGKLEAFGELGEFGRMGNGPDGVRWVSVAGEPALEVTSSISKGGYTDEYREVFLRDGDGFRSGTCIQTAWDDGGAHEKPSEWKARLDYRSDGAIDIHYTAVRRGDHAMPDLTTSRMSFDRANRRWSFDREDGCATPPDPRANDVMFYEPGPN